MTSEPVDWLVSLSQHAWRVLEELSDEPAMLYECSRCRQRLTLGYGAKMLAPDAILSAEANQGVTHECAPVTGPCKPVLVASQGQSPEKPPRDELAMARLARNPNADAVEPAVLLRALADQIEAGELNLDGLCVIGKYTPAAGNHKHYSFIAKMNLPEFVLCVELAKARALQDYRKT